MSLPTRGEWIEISAAALSFSRCSSLSPHGESGLKSENPVVDIEIPSLSPHGESGLKLPSSRDPEYEYRVSPHTGRVD